jgi:hypothetical protein
MRVDGGRMRTTTEQPIPSIHQPTRRRRRPLAAAAALVLTALVGVGVASVVPASASPSVHVRVVHGTFLDPGASITNIQPSGDQFTFDVSGQVQYQGDVTGSSTYSGSGTVDPAANQITMDIKESFTGSIKGIGSGSAVFLDHIVTTEDTSSGDIVSLVVNGSGGLAGATGVLHQSWTALNPDGSIPGRVDGIVVG